MCMVLWALVAAYSHYYGLVIVGILMFMTTLAIGLKNRDKSWIKGAISIIVFLIGYGPWFYFLFTAMKNVSNRWWMTDILSLRKTVSMVLGGHGFNWLILGLMMVLSVVLILREARNPSGEIYAVTVGLATIITTIGFAYFISYAFKPMLAQRYMYPLSAVTFLTLAIAMSRVLKILGEHGHIRFGDLGKIGKGVAFVILLLFIGVGIGNYSVRRDVSIDEENKTKATLSLIGKPEEDTMLVTNGVKHLGWTILPCYFPETEFINGNCYGATKNKFWYFNPIPISEEELQALSQAGYKVISYGQMQISQYVFSLYYMER